MRGLKEFEGMPALKSCGNGPDMLYLVQFNIGYFGWRMPASVSRIKVSGVGNPFYGFPPLLYFQRK